MEPLNRGLEGTCDGLDCALTHGVQKLNSSGVWREARAWGQAVTRWAPGTPEKETRILPSLFPPQTLSFTSNMISKPGLNWQPYFVLVPWDRKGTCDTTHFGDKNTWAQPWHSSGQLSQSWVTMEALWLCLCDPALNLASGLVPKPCPILYLHHICTHAFTNMHFASTENNRT